MSHVHFGPVLTPEWGNGPFGARLERTRLT
jgi:hypothetical protein